MVVWRLVVVGWALVFGVLGCAPRLAPRTAEIARPGEIVGDVNMIVAGVGSGTAQMTREDTGEPLERSGLVSPGAQTPPIGYAMPLWLQGDLRLGVINPCEVGPLLSVPRVGGELRCGLVSQRRDDAPVSVALAGAAAKGLLVSDGGAWWRGGVDVSTRTQGRLMMSSLHLSYGPELHTMKLHDLPSDLVDNGDPFIETFFGRLARAGTWARVERRELRLNMALGMGWWLDDLTWLSVGLVPSMALWTGDEEQLHCTGCTSDLRVDAFGEEFSVELVLGLGFAPEEGWRYDDDTDDEKLVVAGAILAGGGPLMLIGPIVTVTVDNEVPFRDTALLFLPVAGPLLWRSRLDDHITGRDGVENGMVDGVTYTLVATQAAGVTMLLAAWLLGDEEPDDALVTPTVIGDAPGVTAAGRF